MPRPQPPSPRAPPPSTGPPSKRQDVREYAKPVCGQQAGRGKERAKAQQGEVLRRSEAGQIAAATHHHEGLVREEVVLVFGLGSSEVLRLEHHDRQAQRGGSSP